ncbi:MAG: hypothetical protein AAGD43_00050 [Pseudomonadota bacterium]
MTSLISIRATYASDPDRTFADARSFERLRDVMRGLAAYDGLPCTGQLVEGKTYCTDIWFWGLFPVRNHTIHVVKVDVAKRHLITSERHAGIRTWTHSLTVESADGETVWLDQIWIDAGFQTALVARYAQYVYVRKHRRQGALTATSMIKRQIAANLY